MVIKDIKDVEVMDLHASVKLQVKTAELEKYASEEAFYEWFDKRLSYHFVSKEFVKHSGEVISLVLSTPEEAFDPEEPDEEEEHQEAEVIPLYTEDDDGSEYAEAWMRCRNIFAYGTLRHDMEGVGAKEKLGTVVCEACAPGKMHSLSLYPAVVPSDNSLVVGQLINFDSYTDEEWWVLLRMYDKYEQVPTLYRRVLVDVYREKDGTEEPAFIYYYSNPKSLSDSPQVPSGDWKHHLDNRDKWENA